MGEAPDDEGMSVWDEMHYPEDDQNENKAPDYGDEEDDGHDALNGPPRPRYNPSVTSSGEMRKGGKPVQQLGDDGETVVAEFISVSAAAREHGLANHSVTYSCRGVHNLHERRRAALP